MAYSDTTSLHNRLSEVSVETVANYKSWGWPAIVMQNDFIALATIPAIGGRIMQYDLDRNPSIFINRDELGKTYSPSQSEQWHNFGGYKTWPSPQRRWPGN